MKENKENKLNQLRVAILATDGFEEAELLAPRKALDEAGAKTTVVAPKAGKIQGFKHDEKASRVEVELTLDEANPDEFVRSIDKAKKPIAVICHSPWLLASAGLTKGRTLTSYHTIQDDIRNSGANWKDQEVIRDKNWVSSRKPSDIPAFNREMIALFSERRAKSAGA